MNTEQSPAPTRFAALRQRGAALVVAVRTQVRAHPGIVLAFLAVLLTTGVVERGMGRSWLGPDGRFGFWESSIWSQECSQHLADAYSCSHFVHGILFYAVLWVGARRLPVRYRLLMAVLLEAGWELLENSSLIINRYRQTTIALGYDGDSILNSLSDIVTMALGFGFAWRMRPRITVALVLVLELGCALWVRDNLTLNIIMLLHPFESIKAWQLGAQPPI